MITAAVAVPERPTRMPDVPDRRTLFHRLNNQLGVILAHAELLQAKASDEASRARAAQIVASTLEAMATLRQLHREE